MCDPCSVLATAPTDTVKAWAMVQHDHLNDPDLVGRRARVLVQASGVDGDTHLGLVVEGEFREATRHPRRGLGIAVIPDPDAAGLDESQRQMQRELLAHQAEHAAQGHPYSDFWSVGEQTIVLVDAHRDPMTVEQAAAALERAQAEAAASAQRWSDAIALAQRDLAEAQAATQGPPGAQDADRG